MFCLRGQDAGDDCIGMQPGAWLGSGSGERCFGAWIRILWRRDGRVADLRKQLGGELARQAGGMFAVSADKSFFSGVFGVLQAVKGIIATEKRDVNCLSRLAHSGA